MSPLSSEMIKITLFYRLVLHSMIFTNEENRRSRPGSAIWPWTPRSRSWALFCSILFGKSLISGINVNSQARHIDIILIYVTI